MGFRIGTNVSSIAAQRSLSQSDREADRSSKALSSGNRLENPGEDGAGYSIAETLRSQSASLQQARRNSDDAGGLIQVAEGGLNEQNNILVRLRELAVQSSSDTVDDEERDYIHTEAKGLVSEFDRIAKTTTYGHRKLLTGSNKQYDFHVGADNTADDVISYTLDSDTSASSAGISGLDLSSKGEARNSLQEIDDAQAKLAKARAGFGGIQERLQFASSNIDVQSENVDAAHSRIADTDIAAETAKLAQARIKQEFGTSVLAQANQSPLRALRLLA